MEADPGRGPEYYADPREKPTVAPADREPEDEDEDEADTDEDEDDARREDIRTSEDGWNV